MQTLTVSNANAPDLQPFTLSGFTGLLSVRLTQGVYAQGTAFQFANLLVNGTSTATPVPETGGLLLLATGLVSALASKHLMR